MAPFLGCLWLSSARAQSTAAIQASYITFTNPPPIQMLIPGFTVRELPFDLNNINNFFLSANFNWKF